MVYLISQIWYALALCYWQATKHTHTHAHGHTEWVNQLGE